jgi:hypothetical protein
MICAHCNDELDPGDHNCCEACDLQAQLRARISELEEKQHRTEQALSISHRTTDNYREALVRIDEGRYTDEADIRNIAFLALNPPSMHPGDYLKPRD